MHPLRLSSLIQLLIKPMKNKVEETLKSSLGNPEEILKVIVIGVDSSAIEKIAETPELKVIRKIRFINAVAGRLRAKDIIPLSNAPFVKFIELDQEASIQSGMS